MKDKDIIFTLIDDFSEGFDIYINQESKSVWGIFTDEKRWVFELTKEKTLWYNYDFFSGIFKYLSLDVAENQSYITKWVEYTLQNGVKYTQRHGLISERLVEDTLQNGVKYTNLDFRTTFVGVEDTLQNGVKHNQGPCAQSVFSVEDTIQNGVKHTTYGRMMVLFDVEDTLKNGVKETEQHKGTRPSTVEHTIQNGIKHTEYGDWLDYDERINDIIENTRPHFRHAYNPMTFEPVIKEEKRISDVDEVLKTGVKKTRAMDEWVNTENILNKVINSGVKEVQPLPAQDGNRDWGNYYHRQEDITKPHTEYVNEIINDGIRIIQ